MYCMICKQGETHKGTVTVPLQRGKSTILFKNVTAQVCENSGEYYLGEDVTNRLLAQVEQAVSRGAEVEIVRLAA